MKLIAGIFLFILIPALWRLGGSSWGGRWRDVPVPILLGAYIGWVTTWWIGLLSIGSFNIIRMGYGIPDTRPGHEDEGSTLGQALKIPWLVRGTAGACYGLIGGCNVFIYLIVTGGFKYACLFAGYGIVNFGINALGEKMRWDVNVVEVLAGAGVASIVFLI